LAPIEDDGMRSVRSPVKRERTCGWEQYTRVVPIYEYACMKCESHFEELVRSSDQAVTCPECGAAKVLKQLSSFAVVGATSKPSFAGPSGGGGGCCGGSCGCGH
jgi:putative FmdB family regulatory protein